MTQTVTAVYENGVYRPVQPQASPPPEGSVVRLRVTTEDDSLMVEGPTDFAAVRERIRRIAAIQEATPEDPTVTGRDHDRVLYGNPGGAR